MCNKSSSSRCQTKSATTTEGTKHVYYYAFGEFIAEEVEGKSIAYIYGTSILGQIQEGEAYTYFTNGQGDVVYLQDKENKLYNYYEES